MPAFVHSKRDFDVHPLRSPLLGLKTESLIIKQEPTFKPSRVTEQSLAGHISSVQESAYRRSDKAKFSMKLLPTLQEDIRHFGRLLGTTVRPAKRRLWESHSFDDC